jgi:O-antigen ligase
MQPAKALSLVIEVLYLAFFISLACTFRAITSIAIGSLLLAGIIKNWTETKSLFNQKLKNPFLYGCLMLYLIHVIAMLYTNNQLEGWHDIQKKSELVLLPLALCYTPNFTDTIKKRLILYYIFIVAAVSVYCLCYAAWSYFQTGDSSFFFYHQLVERVKGHAIYFSILVFIALLFLLEALEKNSFGFNKTLLIPFIIFLSVFLLLLSSRLVTGFYFLYLVFYFIHLIKNKSVNRFLIIASSVLLIFGSIIILTTANPVSKRFSDITKGDLRVIEMEKFNPGMYFNGLQFRLLQWRFTGEILNENRAWLTGVGPANAQHYFNQKYISTNMYIGEPARGNHGFLGYNAHNQFLETLLQTGIPGLVVLLFICIALLKIAWQKRKKELSFIIALLLAWLFTESPLERQYGILIFTFFPLFLSLDKK